MGLLKVYFRHLSTLSTFSLTSYAEVYGLLVLHLEVLVMNTVAAPQLAISVAHDAIALVNRWLHREVGMAVHATEAYFNRDTFCWHVPLELAYATHGTLGVVGDAYLHATTSAFAGRPQAEELIRRAEALATACGIEAC